MVDWQFLIRLTSTPHWRTGPDLCRGAPGYGTRRRNQGSAVKQSQIPLKHNLACRPFSGRRSRRSVRSGYAFAHSEGFGRLITSGRIMREVTFILFEATSDELCLQGWWFGGRAWQGRQWVESGFRRWAVFSVRQECKQEQWDLSQGSRKAW